LALFAFRKSILGLALDLGF